MRSRLLFVSIALLSVSLAGCVSGDDEGLTDGVYDPESDRFVQTLPFGAEIVWAPGALSSIHNPTEGPISVGLPFGWLSIEGDEDDPGSIALPQSGSIVVPAGETSWLLAPPRDGPQQFAVGSEIVTLDPAAVTDAIPREQVISGENVWELSAYQEEHFPHRQVNLPGGNYWNAVHYFADYFEDLGMEVEVDPYGTEELTMDGQVCTPNPGLPTDTREPCPGSLANIVATLPGTDPDAPTIFVAGGHYDMVETTTHAAFDDTSGTVATLELARAMSQFEWRHTLKFGLWGGEEDGIVGSQFWVHSNPDAKAEITLYWNLDVVGMSWPAPLNEPDPIVIAAGPDAPKGEGAEPAGPMAESLLAIARELQTKWFEHPSNVDGVPMWHYEGVAAGQGAATGTTGNVGQGAVGGYAGVNAASDHTPFIAAGIPAYFIFNGDALAGDNPVKLHTESDTLENMTRYAYFGGLETQAIMAQEESGVPYHWDPVEYAEAQRALAESWEVIMWFPFYSTVLQDTGYWTSPGVAGQSSS